MKRFQHLFNLKYLGILVFHAILLITTSSILVIFIISKIFFLGFCLVFLCCILVLWSTLFAIFAPFFFVTSVCSASMEPTIKTGSFIAIETISKNLRNEISRGSVGLFALPEISKTRMNNKILRCLYGEKELVVKRIIGLPRDEIEIFGGRLYLNGNPYDYEIEELKFNYELRLGRDFKNPIYCKLDANQKIIVPESHYFILGDNTNYSMDSHIFGCVPSERLIGIMFSNFKIDFFSNK